MSLRVFHLVFIALSILMCLFVGTWGVTEHATRATPGSLVLGVACFALGAALAVYLVRVYRKLEALGR
jgi:hypothetical protein